MKYKIYKMFKYILSDKHYIILTSYLKTREIPNIKKPETFYDKIQYLKINKKLEGYMNFVDKYKVRRYIEKKIGNIYLIPLIGVYRDVNEINFNNLPKQFVLKANHSSGQNIVCRNKENIDTKKIKKKLLKWINENFYYKLREIQYKNIKPLIICEKYLEDSSGELMDYKFFCSNGKPEFIQVDIGRFSDHKRNFYNLKWEKLEWKCEHDNFEDQVKKPINLEEMINVATKLSEDFPFVRVDLYSVNDKVYFGELTFTPGAGIELYEPQEINKFVGDLIDITQY